MHLRVATYNIHRCIGRDGNENIARIAAVLSEIDADIIALQEVTSHLKADADMLAYLAEAAGMEAVAGFTFTVAGAPYGNALLTRLPFAAVKRIDISMPRREPRGLIEAVLKCDRRKVLVLATHLGLGVRERRFQMRCLLNILDAADGDVAMLLGDFNEWLSWSRSLRALRRRFGATPTPATFPAWRPFLKLDRIWIRPACGSTILRAHSTRLSRTASDHLPLVADVII